MAADRCAGILIGSRATLGPVGGDLDGVVGSWSAVESRRQVSIHDGDNSAHSLGIGGSLGPKLRLKSRLFCKSSTSVLALYP